MSFSLVLRSMEAELGLVAMAACDAVPERDPSDHFSKTRIEEKRCSQQQRR